MSTHDQPQVSVVIAVYNAPHHAGEAITSVLTQDDISFECVVIDDGSDDATPSVLGDLASQDARVRVLRTEHGGLTRALIAGCDAARGPYIARLDADDLMLPQRLATQHAALSREPDVAVLASAFRLCGPCGEHLEDVHRTTSPVDLTPSMGDAASPLLEGIAHPTVMFRTAHYRRVGGYRRQFTLAQDVDLWARMAEVGRVLRDGQMLTETRVGLESLSPRHHRLQQRLRKIAQSAARARRTGDDEIPWLREAERLCAGSLDRAVRRGDWRAAYFVASCLDRRGDSHAARDYYREAAARSPLALRPRLRLAMLSMRRA